MHLPNTPWGETGYIVYKRTYARRLDSNNPNSATEEFPDTVNRVLEACENQLQVGFTPEEATRLRNYMLQLKGTVAGRFLWQLGTETVAKHGLLSLQNCAGVVVNSPIRPFTWAFDALMLGSGVGFNIQRKNVYELPKLKGPVTITRVDTAGADFVVPDSREGWVKLLGKVLKAHFYSGEGFTYSTQLIRGKGAPIKGFGGTASGPEELCQGIAQIHTLLNGKAGMKLEPIDCLDIMNIIGSIVVAGNVRRSAQIAIGDPDDLAFLKAKAWWQEGGIPNWRSMSNNSVACEDISTLPQEFWDTYEKGEPYGLINLRLARLVGRLGETQYQDLNVEVFNPCAEQSLENFETCCLAEIFLPNITSQEEMEDVVTLLYRVNKHSLSLPCHLKETQDIVHRNMRMGIGVTGLLECSEEQLSWLSPTYTHLREYDVAYSERMGWPVSIKLTTVKPSGSLSLLPGVTPGIHPSPAGPHYLRRVRVAAGNPLVEVIQSHGYPVEPQRKFDGTTDHTTMVASFPCKVSPGTLVAGQIGAVEHLELVKQMQTLWSDNSVSCTVYYTKEELPQIKEWLQTNYREGVKTVSFLLYQGHGFDQAPYETISEELYTELKGKTKALTSIQSNTEEVEVDNMDGCISGVCPIR